MLGIYFVCSVVLMVEEEYNETRWALTLNDVCLSSRRQVLVFPTALELIFLWSPVNLAWGFSGSLSFQVHPSTGLEAGNGQLRRCLSSLNAHAHSVPLN